VNSLAQASAIFLFRVDDSRATLREQPAGRGIANITGKIAVSGRFANTDGGSGPRSTCAGAPVGSLIDISSSGYRLAEESS
jgi:hypothetical protein